eukprot:CAMPEP_0119372134 /NCGR_PEP_ID=MMETSP1334-20130426/18162_1 /TAXON_ID=127549 /ORGANISM="Calcidiscus leptoporus, Strain RCC1130" /LENGTH=296 /DNA_ID=CAMNT_0007389547 /DNA_START=39 /DNA_END=929 /DNA_ORIENTATION=-
MSSRLTLLLLALAASGAAALRLAPPVMQLEREQAVSNFQAAAPPVGAAPPSGRVMPTRPPPQVLQGGSLRTWSYRSPAVEQVQVILTTGGRPLDADIELWQGPGYTASKMRVYVEDGQRSPFNAVIETPRSPNTVAIRNVGPNVFPFTADLIAGDASSVSMPTPECLASPIMVQGGALRTYPFDPTVDSVQVLLLTDGRPLNARIELLQGPNNNKQVIELYCDDGRDRPFFCILATPGSGNVVRIVNTAPMEFPMYSAVLPYSFSQGRTPDHVPGGDVVIGGTAGFGDRSGRAWWE